MIKLSLDNVQKFLASRGINAHPEKVTNQLYVMMKHGNLEYPMFMRVYENDSLLQLLIFIPCSIQDGCQPDLARLLLLINKEIDIPGYGMDEAASVVFYRVMLPTHEGQLEEKLINLYLDAFEPLCNIFTAPIMAAASGKMTYNEILKELKGSTSKV